ncbi:MAG: hypothetical protein AAGL89_03965 [Pseudomonadota bacterium]
MSGGIKYGDVMIHGAIFVRRGGKKKVMVRHGKKRWAFGEVTIPLADRMMIFFEQNVYGDLSSNFFRHYLQEIRARTILGVGKQ